MSSGRNQHHVSRSIALEYDQDQESSVSDCESSVTGSAQAEPELFNGVLARIDEEEKEYNVIKLRFVTRSGQHLEKIRVAAIHRMIWSSFTAQAKLQTFQIYFRALASKNGGNANARYAWFGTSKEGVNRIATHGFGEAEIRGNSGLFGRGIYLSPDNSLLESVLSSVPDEDGLRHILLCKVILGKMEVVPRGSEQSNPSSMAFDSGVDNLASPKKYIVWSVNMNTHILPDYVVTLSGSSPTIESLRMEHTEMKMPTSPWMAFPALITELSKFLPPDTITLIRNYYKDFKEKRIARRELIQYLRGLAGDKLLASVIKSCKAKA